MAAKALAMIFITGAARSGTSLTTKILQAHGLYLGDASQINDLYEHQNIRQTILKPMLTKVGADPLGQGPLPDMTKFRPDAHLRGRVIRQFNGELNALYGYKDAKLTLTWPMWHAAFPEAKWIIVRRETEEIIDSCLRTHFMKRHGSNRNLWHGWVNFHVLQFAVMRHEGLNTIEIWPSEFINAPVKIKPAIEFCDLDSFHPELVAQQIDPNLWRS